MTIKPKICLLLLFAIVPTISNALGLGDLELKSSLNEPFEANIELLSATSDELDSLSLALADRDASARASLDRPWVPGKLSSVLHRSVGSSPDYIRVFSTEPVSEPALGFLIEVSWSNGRLYREYTVSLDAPPVRSEELKPGPAPVAKLVDPDHTVVYGDDFDSYQFAPAGVVGPQLHYFGGDYGPTADADTLWSIAGVMRPDTSISVNRMMLALLSTHPDAFLENNINGLKRGQVLRMPSESEMDALTNAQALTEVRLQHAQWHHVRGHLPGTATQPAEVSPSPVEESMTSDSVVMPQDQDPELKLLTAHDLDPVTEQAASVDPGNDQALILAQESLQVLTQENLELKDQLHASEASLQDLKRLLSLKDDELAALQDQQSLQVLTQENLELKDQLHAFEASLQDLKRSLSFKDDELAALQDQLVAAETEIPVEPMLVTAEDTMVIEDEAVMDEAPMVETEASAVTATAAPVAGEEEVLEGEDVIEFMEIEPDVDLMAMVNQYLGPVKDMLLGNPIIGMAIGAVLIILIIIFALLKFRQPAGEDEGNAEKGAGNEGTALDFDVEGDDIELDLSGEASSDPGDDSDANPLEFDIDPDAEEPDKPSDNEIATKLDLAKAYVELGDSDNAKSILDEVIANGSDEQRKQAEELLAQT